MSKKTSARKRTPGSLHPAGYTALTKKAFNVARKAARHHRGWEANKPWDELAPAAKYGWEAAVVWLLKTTRAV